MYNRKLNRLRNFDYTSAGYYFITICTYGKLKHFGSVEEGKVVLNEYGRIAEKYWKEIPAHYSEVLLDVFVVMSNHIHGIIILLPGESSPSISTIIKSFKQAVVKQMRVKFNQEFVWHRSFYDSIIRDEQDLFRIREYILNNPAKWDSDSLNSAERAAPLAKSTAR